MVYHPGDEVQVSTNFFDSRGTQIKLNPAWLDPFEVKSEAESKASRQQRKLQKLGGPHDWELVPANMSSSCNYQK